MQKKESITTAPYIGVSSLKKGEFRDLCSGRSGENAAQGGRGWKFGFLKSMITELVYLQH